MRSDIEESDSDRRDRGHHLHGRVLDLCRWLKSFEESFAYGRCAGKPHIRYGSIARPKPSIIVTFVDIYEPWEWSLEIY